MGKCQDVDLKLRRELAKGYKSRSQIARVLTEEWAGRSVYCLACGIDPLKMMQTNTPVHDFQCADCSSRYQLKSKGGAFGGSVQNSEYYKKREAILKSANPSYLFLSYETKKLVVTDLFAIPRHFVTLSIIDKRKPLSANAKRHGWVGSTIRLDRLPPDAKIPIIRESNQFPKSQVLAEWATFRFLDDKDAESRGWLGDVLECVRRFERNSRSSAFSNQDMYQFEDELTVRHPLNHHIRDKIRQQLQVLISKGILRRAGTNKYEAVHPETWSQSQLGEFLGRVAK